MQAGGVNKLNPGLCLLFLVSQGMIFCVVCMITVVANLRYVEGWRHGKVFASC